MDQALLKYTEYSELHESLTNTNNMVDIKSKLIVFFLNLFNIY